MYSVPLAIDGTKQSGKNELEASRGTAQMWDVLKTARSCRSSTFWVLARALKLVCHLAIAKCPGWRGNGASKCRNPVPIAIVLILAKFIIIANHCLLAIFKALNHDHSYRRLVV